MTIKNIMFSGVMAVILGAVVAPAMAVEVTSKKYVDEKVVAAVADKADQSALTQEIADRAAADQTLLDQISSEATARANADDAIEAAYQAADSSLQSQIDGKVAATQETTNGVVTTDATGKVQVSTAISQDQVVGLKEALSALPTDVTVAGKVDKEQGAENANKVVVTDATGAITAAAMIEQAQVNGLVDALGAKASQTDLSAEITNRTNADNSLQTEIDKKQAKLTAGEGIEIDAETNTITATAEAIEYTSGNAYVEVNNETDQITVVADDAIVAGATGLATSQAVMNYTLPVPADCAETTCVLGVQKDSKTPTWLKLEMGE